MDAITHQVKSLDFAACFWEYFFPCDLMLVDLKLILLSRQLNSLFKHFFSFCLGLSSVSLWLVSCDLMWERRVRDGYLKWRKNYDSQQLLDVDVNFTCGSLGLVYLWIGKIEVREVRSAQKEVERERKRERVKALQDIAYTVLNGNCNQPNYHQTQTHKHIQVLETQ